MSLFRTPGWSFHRSVTLWRRALARAVNVPLLPSEARNPCHAVHVIILVVPTPVVPCGAVPPSGPDGPTKQALFKQTEITNSLL